MTSIGFVQGYYPQQSWAYDMFGSSGLISPSIMSPNDTLGAINDAKLFGNIFAVDALATSSAMLSNTAPIMMNQFWANLAKYWQQMMMNLQNTMSTDITQTLPGGQTPSNPVNPITNPTGRISENRIVTILDRIGKLDDRLQTEGEFDGKKMTYLDRLKDLLDEYRKDPENARLSKENYEKIWDILSDCYKTGVLSSENWAALKKIAENPGESTTPAGSNSNNNGFTGVARPDRNVQAISGKENGIDQIASNYFEAMSGPGTTNDLMKNASKEVNKDNVLEVINEYNKINQYDDGLTLIEKIFDDFNGWGKGVKTHIFTRRENARPYVLKLKDSLKERTENLINSGNCDEKTVKLLQEKLDKLETEITALDTKLGNKDEISNDDGTNIIDAFDELVKELNTVESSLYKEFDEKYNLEV